MTEQQAIGTANEASSLQVHFFLKDGAHAMDALVLHKCEGELFALIKEVSRILGVEVSIENTAYREGGLIVTLQFISENSVAIGIISTSITAICSASVWMKYQRVLLKQKIEQNDFALNRDKKLAEQQYIQNELAIQKARSELKRLGKEESESAPKAPHSEATRSLSLEPPPQAQDIIPALLSKPKIVKHRSQFYEGLLGYQKVTHVSFGSCAANEPGQEYLVNRSDFSSYVVLAANHDKKTLSDVEIEIVSAILSGDMYKWKGVCSFGTINFTLEDEDFIDKVKTKKIKFQAGTTLVCEMDVFYRDDAKGEPEPYKYVVTDVGRHFNKRSKKNSKPENAALEVAKPQLMIAEIKDRKKLPQQQEIPLVPPQAPSE